jgi:hypothetical protein
MRKATVIYKTEDGYLTNGVKLLENISEEIDGYLITQKLNLDGQDLFRSFPTEIGNEYLLFGDKLELGNYFLVDQKHRSIDTNLKIIVEFSMKMRESIVE